MGIDNPYLMCYFQSGFSSFLSNLETILKSIAIRGTSLDKTNDSNALFYPFIRR